jgi:hypothetical protein
VRIERTPGLALHEEVDEVDDPLVDERVAPGGEEGRRHVTDRVDGVDDLCLCAVARQVGLDVGHHHLAHCTSTSHNTRPATERWRRARLVNHFISFVLFVLFNCVFLTRGEG